MTYDQDVKDFYELCKERERLKLERKHITFEAKEVKYKLCKHFRNNNKKYFLIADVLILFAILMNVGAAAMTSNLVVKETYDEAVEVGGITAGKEAVENMEFVETNPVVARAQNYAEHPKSVIIFSGLLLKMIGFITIAWYYLYLRQGIHKPSGFVALYFFAMILVFGLSYDFFNNFGYYLGILNYGA